MIAAAIPARNEEARIGCAVAALRSEGVNRIIVVANACTDATAERAKAAGADVLVCGRLKGGVGEARALGCAAALAKWPRAEILISTDADGRIAQGCVPALERALEHADAVMGRLVDDADELAALPPQVIGLRRLEERRNTLLAEIGSLTVPRPHDPLPRHLDRAGGLMAFRRAAYVGVGGFRHMSCHEDRDIAARLSLKGFKTAHPWDATVTVSCRTTGRAPEGMSTAIAAQITADCEMLAERIALQCVRLERVVHAMRKSRSVASGDLARLVRDRHPPQELIGFEPRDYADTSRLTG